MYWKEIIISKTERHLTCFLVTLFALTARDIYKRTDFEPKSITLEELNIEISSLMLWNQR